jgi:hypothetical protein
MLRVDELLAALRTAPVKRVPVASITQDPVLQPRSPHAVIKQLERQRLDDVSERHIAAMAAVLADDPKRELVPVLVADVDGIAMLVDGHHRIAAYRLSKRGTIPARKLKMTRAEAVHVSKLVNLGQTALALHPDQAREACWQHIAMLMQGGKVGLPKGVTYRGLEALFGDGAKKDTVSRMVKRVKTLRRAEFGPDACDPGTGWPLWKHCKGNAPRDAFDEVLDRTDKQCLLAVSRLMERFDVDRVLRSFHRWLGEEIEVAEEEAADIDENDKDPEAAAAAHRIVEMLRDARHALGADPHPEF